MINGLIKLFYSEIVKTKMKSMNSNGYDVRDEYKGIRDITLKIDSVFYKILKLALGCIVILLAYSINKILSVGVVLVGIIYIIYKIKLEVEIKEYIANIKTNIEVSKIANIKEKGRIGINALITLLVIGFLTGFNIFIVCSFAIVFMFTLKNIC
ncbi:hypothetical protein [Metaclostridioides mangenotii]|uniref:hypothetical protein n=1 Tax=Metaclostridioides mangenotii TaxID=1540 RepID=UPI00046531F2|nr:hypothetical protein [Clostridioides mangenotii]